jgi:5-formyltetrahydrofolate cyclo-ligase
VNAPSARLRREKKAVRVRVRALRDALPEAARERASLAISERVLALPELAGVSTALVFASFGAEVDTRPIIEGLVERGVRVVLPRVDGSDIVAATYDVGDPMIVAPFGMPEPAGGQVVALDAIDLAVTPGIAFDRSGHRVGYGGGFYDRFFASARRDLSKVAVCFAVQVVDGELPHGGFDVAVDLVVTEHEVIRAVAVR